MRNVKDIFSALYFAAKKHSNQRRKGPNKEPYINHLIEVLTLLLEKTDIQSADIIIAGVLHDILEDTNCTEEDLEQLFGSNVLMLVEKLTDDKSLSLETRRKIQLKHVSVFSNDLKLIKLADHCSNIASIPPDWSRDKLKNYLAWSFNIAKSCSGVSAKLDAEYKQRYQEALI